MQSGLINNEPRSQNSMSCAARREEPYLYVAQSYPGLKTSPCPRAPYQLRFLTRAYLSRCVHVYRIRKLSILSRLSSSTKQAAARVGASLPALPGSRNDVASTSWWSLHVLAVRVKKTWQDDTTTVASVDAFSFDVHGRVCGCRQTICIPAYNGYRSSRLVFIRPMSDASDALRYRHHEITRCRHVEPKVVSQRIPTALV